MATAAASSHAALARTLPERLLRFFANNPPRVVAAHQQQESSSSSSTTAATSSSTTTTSPATADLPARFHAWRNPFQPHKHPQSGRWHPPIYSLRQQAELVKLAAAHGVDALLPPSVKSSSERTARRLQHGLRVRGTGVGQRPKGHQWERALPDKLDARRKAMLDMPRLVQEWKLRGHGRGIKKWPK